MPLFLYIKFCKGLNVNFYNELIVSFIELLPYYTFSIYNNDLYMMFYGIFKILDLIWKP